MFARFKKLFAPEVEPDTPADESTTDPRLEAMIDAYGAPDQVFADPDPARGIDVLAFGRNFVQECDDDAVDDEGYVLITRGMSNRAMTAPADYDGEESLYAELIWYVREPNPDYVSVLRWLAELPFIDHTWFGSGHRVPMPAPPLPNCAFSTCLFLPSIITTDAELLEHIERDGQPIRTLVVHLISPAEYELVKTDDGLNAFLDRLDENDHPIIFDPDRRSYV